MRMRRVVCGRCGSLAYGPHAGAVHVAGRGRHDVGGLPRPLWRLAQEAKLLGVVLLLARGPARLKEWAYAGFAITLGSALIAHLSVADGPEAGGGAAATGVFWGLSYFFWRRVQATPGSA